MKSRGENRARWKVGVGEKRGPSRWPAASQQISTGVTNDPGRRDRRASRKLFDTLGAVLHSLTRTSLHTHTLSLSLSLFVSLFHPRLLHHRLYLTTHTQAFTFERGWRDANLYWNFSPFAERFALALIERRKPLSRIAGVRVCPSPLPSPSP